MRRSLAVGIALVSVIGVGACLDPGAPACADGVVCPTDRVCAPRGGGCADADQVAACEGRADAQACSLPGIGEGRCREGLCVVAACGDGVVDLGEACDDGNTADGDACTSACAVPTCGDGRVDLGEACDDGAANGDDRACTSRCVLAVCGDRLVQAGVEGCDAGLDNTDDGACTAACSRAACGDGHVFAGVETCDDGNLLSGDGCRGDCAKIEACGDAAIDAGEACDDGNGNTVDGCDACAMTAWSASALIGGASLGPQVALRNPRGVAVAADRTVFVADTESQRVRRIDRETGVMTTFAGAGGYGFSGDGGLATDARLANPRGVAVDGLGNVFIADTDNDRIRRVDVQTRVITTVVGDAGELRRPAAVVVDGLGRLYIADYGHGAVRRFDPATRELAAVPGLWVATPSGLALRGQDLLYVADEQLHRVWRVDLVGGTATPFAGNGTGSTVSPVDDVAALDTTVTFPAHLAVGPDGDVYLTEAYSHRIRRVDVETGLISRAAGSGAEALAGDGGPALQAHFAAPQGIAVSRQGALVIADTKNHRVRQVDADTQVVTTIAGTVASGYSGDGGLGTSARMTDPSGVAVAPDGDIVLSDESEHRVRRVDDDTRVITTVGGTGRCCQSDDGVPANAAPIFFPKAVAVDADGHVHFSEGSRVRRIDAASGLISTAAGTLFGSDGSGDGGLATSAQVDPRGLAFAADRTLYIADLQNHRIRRIDGETRIISTYAGGGAVDGDGGLATDAQLSSPYGVAVDRDGHVFIADTGHHRIRRVDLATGVITTFAGTGALGAGGDGGLATSAALSAPKGVAVDRDGNVFIADTDNHRVRRVDHATGVITTVVGDGVPGFDGDGLPGTLGRVNRPTGVAVAGDGDVLISCAGDGRVRRYDVATETLSTVAGSIDPEGTGPLAQARLALPEALAVAEPFTLFAGGASATVQAVLATGATLEVVAGNYPQAGVAGDRARLRGWGFGRVAGVAYDAATGRIYLTEASAHRVHAVSVVDPVAPETWTLAAVVNVDGTPGFADGAAATARLRSPAGLFFDDTTRELLIADAGNHVVRALAVDSGQVTTLAGTPATLGFFGDGLAATQALLYAPAAITRCAATGDLFIADAGNHRVRRVAAGSGTISTVLGDGVAASSGQGQPASSFPVDDPRGLACDAAGNLYVTSTTAVRLLPASIDVGESAGEVTGEGPVATIYGAPPRSSFPANATVCLTGIAAVDAETVWATDACAGILVELWRQPVAPP